MKRFLQVLLLTAVTTGVVGGLGVADARANHGTSRASTHVGYRPAPARSRQTALLARRDTDGIRHRSRLATPASYYLALGDSVPVWNGADSYPYVITRRYERELPAMQLDDIAVSGETTTSMLQDGQYAQAISFLQAHKGHIALITIDIGGNDIFPCALSVSSASPSSPCSVQARATIRQNLSTMLSGLRAAAPGVPVIGMSYYESAARGLVGRRN